jgi:hypothetical protein
VSEIFIAHQAYHFLTQDWLLHQVFDSLFQLHYHSCQSKSASLWANGRVEHQPRPPHHPAIRWHLLHHTKEPLPPVLRELFDVRIAFCLDYGGSTKLRSLPSSLRSYLILHPRRWHKIWTLLSHWDARYHGKSDMCHTDWTAV